MSTFMLYPAGLSHSKRNIIRADSWTATKAVMSQDAMLNGSKKAVGEMIPVRFATTIAVPDSCKQKLNMRGISVLQNCRISSQTRKGAVKSTTDSLSAFILREVSTISNFLPRRAAISPFQAPFCNNTFNNNTASSWSRACIVVLNNEKIILCGA